MSDVEQVVGDGGHSDGERSKVAGDLSGRAPSRSDYAAYIEEMSADLARISDNARLSHAIGRLLRMASLAAHEVVTGRDVKARRRQP